MNISADELIKVVRTVANNNVCPICSKYEINGFKYFSSNILLYFRNT